MKTFRDLAKTNINYLSYSLFIVSQFHIFHWLTRNGQDHESIGEYYVGIQEEVDSFAERVIGKYDMPESKDSFELDMQFSKEQAIEMLEAYDVLTDNNIKKYDSVKDAAIIDALVDIKELNDKLRYKFRLE